MSNTYDRDYEDMITGVQVNHGFFPVEHLHAIMAGVWEALFTETIDVASLRELSTLPWNGTVKAVLAITGGWDGHVAVTMPRAFACEAATTLFALPDGDAPSDAEVVDVAGEIANIVAGNLKALLPEPSTLGLPHVAEHPGHPPMALSVPREVSSYYVTGGHLIYVEVNPAVPAPDTDTGAALSTGSAINPFAAPTGPTIARPHEGTTP